MLLFLFFLFFQNTEGNIKSNYKYELLLHMQNLKLNQDVNFVDHFFFKMMQLRPCFQIISNFCHSIVIFNGTLFYFWKYFSQNREKDKNIGR